MSGRAGAWSGFGEQLRHPSGRWAAVIGRLMALANRRPNRIAIDALQVAPDDVVLELGFGPGQAIHRLAALTPTGRVFGVDQSAAMLAQAARQNRRAILNGHVNLRQGRFDALPWAADSVDKILAVNVAYFFGCDDVEVREAKRVLRPGGAIVIYVTDSSAMARWKFVRPETHRCFDGDALEALLRGGGFPRSDIAISDTKIAFGIRGLLARARKPI